MSRLDVSLKTISKYPFLLQPFTFLLRAFKALFSFSLASKVNCDKINILIFCSILFWKEG